MTWKLENKPRKNTCNLRPAKNKTKETQADFRGNLHVSRELVAFLSACMEEGKEPLLSVQGWDNGIVNRAKEGQYGPNIRLSIQQYDESWMDKSPQQPRPQQQPSQEVEIDDEIPF
mgnify:FL=1